MHAALKEQIAGLERRLWLEGSEAFDKGTSQKTENKVR